MQVLSKLHELFPFYVKNICLCEAANHTVAEFIEFERRFKFKPRFKYGGFHLQLYQMFQDLSRRLI